MSSDRGSGGVAVFSLKDCYRPLEATRQHRVFLLFFMGTEIISPFPVERSIAPAAGIKTVTGYHNIPIFAKALHYEQVGASVTVYLLALGFLLMQFQTLAVGAEIKAFKLTDFGGSLRLGYSLTDRNVEYAHGGGMSERRPTLEQELTLNSMSYIFHPNLLEMELGGSVKFSQESLESEQTSNEVRNNLYSFNSRFSLLKNKPYPLQLYYNQSNPSASVGLADSLTLEERDYGFNFSLRAPLVSSPMQLYASHRETTGDGFDTIVDDTTDTAIFRISTSLGGHGHGQFGLSSTTTNSGSGSMNLPIQESKSSTKSATWDSRLLFGPDDSIKLVNTITLTRDEQSNTSDRDDGRFYINLDWDHTDSLRTFYSYNLARTKYDYDKITNQNLSIGALRRWQDVLSLTTSVAASSDTSESFEKKSYEVDGNIAYRDDLNARWRMNSGYSLLYRVNTQNTDVSVIRVHNESHVLNGLGSVALNNEYVLHSTIIVSNSTHTQIYRKDVDYVLTKVGEETRLARKASGGIADGAEVVLEYAYESGGSYDFDELSQSLNLGYTLDNTHRFHLHYMLRRKILREGDPANFIESSRRIRVGTDSRVPLSQTISIGWKLDFEKQIDDSKPFTRDAAGLNLRTALPWLTGSLDLDSRYEHVDNENSENDLRLTRYSALASTRVGMRSSMGIELVHERDTGGETPNTTRYATLTYNWQRRLLGFSLEAKYGTEEQGDFSRSDTRIKADLVRKIR